jgi:hypothetical protein
MARPKKGEEKRHSEHVRVGMTPELRAAIDARVTETGKTIVDVILPVLEREFLGKRKKKGQCPTSSAASNLTSAAS